MKEKYNAKEVLDKLVESDDPVPPEEEVPYYLNKEKINMYSTSGKYIKTFDNLKDIKKYLIDNVGNGVIHNFHSEYINIIKAIDKNNRSIYGYMFRSFKNNEECEDIEPYRFTGITCGESKPVVIIDIYTKIQKSYESISSLERDFGFGTDCISIYVRNKWIYKKKYYIFLENDPAPNVEDIISNYLKDHPVPPEEEVPYYLNKEKINMYSTSGKYVNTFNNLKEIRDYLLNNYNHRYSYTHIVKIIDENHGSICGYMLRSFKNNEECEDIEPYSGRSRTTGESKPKSVILMDITTKNQTTYESINSLAKEFGVSCTCISYYIKMNTLFREKYCIFI